MTKIAVSSGDPAGIGPDICIKAFGNKKILSYKPIVFGNIDLFVERAKQINQEINIREYKGEEEDSISNDFLWMVDKPIGVDISSSKLVQADFEIIQKAISDNINLTPDSYTSLKDKFRLIALKALANNHGLFSNTESDKNETKRTNELKFG